MASEAEFLRFASPNELRTIAREDAGYYRAVIIGAIYNFPADFDITSPRSYFHPLKLCIEKHPFFTVTVGERHSDKAFYQRVPSINLKEHVSIVQDQAAVADPMGSIEKLIASELSAPCSTAIPPWKIVVLPLRASEVFIALSFSHMIGDGPAALAFHKTFLAGCNELPNTESLSVITPPRTPLPAPFDTPERLPISWGFLLEPFIAQYLPQSIAKLLRLRTGAAHIDEGTWTGSPMFFEPKGCRSKIRIHEIDAPLVRKAVQVARQHDAKLTGAIQVIITRALSHALPDPTYTNFVSETAVNMRRSVGISNDSDGLFVSGTYIMHPRPSKLTGPLSENEWDIARSATAELAKVASTLQDQPIGLLRYVSSIRNWTRSKLGLQRDSSFGVSNLGLFDPGVDLSQTGTASTIISKLVFAQPGHAISAPITFNFVSAVGGNLVYTAAWQPGAIGLDTSIDEERLVDAICSMIDQGIQELA